MAHKGLEAREFLIEIFNIVDMFYFTFSFVPRYTINLNFDEIAQCPTDNIFDYIQILLNFNVPNFLKTSHTACHSTVDGSTVCIHQKQFSHHIQRFMLIMLGSMDVLRILVG